MKKGKLEKTRILSFRRLIKTRFKMKKAKNKRKSLDEAERLSY